MSRAARGERGRRAREQHRERVWLAAAVIFVVTALCFTPAIDGQFLSWDDAKNFVANPWYRGLGWDQLRWMWSTTLLGHYVPVSWMTLGADYLLWGMNPRGYHVTNIVIHAANAVLVFFVARRLLRARDAHVDRRSAFSAAGFAALFFAIHPLRVESVAWITERRDVLSLCLALASLLLYLRACDDGAHFRRWYSLSLLAFVAALLSKATIVTLPAVLLVLNVYPLRRLGGDAGWTSAAARRVYLEIAPFTLLSIAVGIGSVAALPLGAQLTPGAKIAVSFYGTVFYLWKTLLPLRLSPLYQMPAHVNPLAPRFVVSGVIVLALTAALWVVRRRKPGLVAAMAAWFLVTLPLLGAVQNGNQIAADRYTYHAGAALAIAAGAALFTWRLRRDTALLVGGLVVLVLGVLTWKQCEIWHDSLALWSRALEIDASSAIAHNDLGIELAAAGRTAEAIENYRAAITLDSTYAHPHNNLGFELAQIGRADEATAEYRAALAIDPRYVEAELNWGNVSLAQQRFDEAIVHYQRAASLDPTHAGAQFNWGLALMRLGRAADAAQHFARAAELDPTDQDAKDALQKARAAARTTLMPR